MIVCEGNLISQAVLKNQVKNRNRMKNVDYLSG